MTTPTPISNAVQMYREQLKQRNINDMEAHKLGLKCLSAEECSALLGAQTRHSGMLLPYPHTDSFFRIRMFGGMNKYLSQKGSGTPPPYLSSLVPWDWEDIKVDVSKPIIITEGEFKGVEGCRTGVPTVGIGGVEMQATLFTTGWIWTERPVFVCFDHDKGQEPGHYKPGVANALGKLCSSLRQHGAIVKVLHVGLACPDPAKKWGLDDLLLSEGTEVMGKLLETASDPPEWCSKLADMLDDCVYVTGTNHVHIYNLKNGSRKSPTDFHDTHIEKKRWETNEDGKTKVKQISRIWVEHPGRVTAENYTMDPRHPFGMIEEQGKVNLWRGYPVWPLGREGVKEQWQRFMEGLFGEHWKWVGLWTGHMLNRPWEPTNQAVMLTTRVQGIGKSLYGDIVRDLVGVHGLECSADRMFDKFNSAMEGKTFVCVNELDIKFSGKEGAMNDLLSAETVVVEQKGKDTIELPNLRRWYLTTNASSPCRLSAGQRRVLVLSPPRVEGDTRGEWGTWVREVVASWRKDARAMGAIREWFDELWFGSGEGDGKWDSTCPVMRTVEGDELAELSMTNTQVIAEELWKLARESAGGWVAAAPMTRAQHRAIFLELTAIVKARGGFVGQKKVVDGGEYNYTVYDVRGSIPRTTKANGGHKLSVSSGEAKDSATKVAIAVADLDRILTGKG